MSNSPCPFQSTDNDESRWAVNMIVLDFYLQAKRRPEYGRGSDAADLYKQARGRLDRLYSGRFSPAEIMSECAEPEPEFWLPEGDVSQGA